MVAVSTPLYPQNKTPIVINQFPQFKTPQYNANHQKQNLVITRSMISHCLTEPLESLKFSPQIRLRLQIPQVPHLTSKTHFRNSLRKILGEFFHPWAHARNFYTYFLALKIFVSLIYIRNKKRKSWTHHASRIVEHKT